MALRTLIFSLFVSCLAAGAALADTTPFDLSGPALKVTVSRGAVTLPIWRTPALSPGDVLVVRPDLPPGDGARYLLVVAFLRGAANPPPKAWFHKAKTWGRRGSDGVRAIVPAGAEQAVVFLAPATGGDFKTLVNAVRGRPGAFVRAAQALHQASLERSRMDAFLKGIRNVHGGPNALKAVSPLLARSLSVKLNQDCLKKTPELQAACLTHGENALVLDDGHSPSMVQTLTTGNSADFALSVSATPKAGLGYYSPYIAAVMDMAHILDSLHTARYQYIPALPSGQAGELVLQLNTAPSFHDPKSVLVTTLPPVEPARTPRLEVVDPTSSFCLDRAHLVLPVQGAPLAFSTGYARNLMLRVKDARGRDQYLPVRADAAEGGLVVDTSAAAEAPPAGEADGTLVGDWGFAPFQGPDFRLESVAGARWMLPPAEAGALVAGRDDKLLVRGSAPACVKEVELKREGLPSEPVAWAPAADGVIVTLRLSNAAPGPMSLLVETYGAKPAQAISLTSFAQAGRLDGFVLHAGDADGVLEGARLDQVKDVEVDGIRFEPAALSSTGGADQLPVHAADVSALADLVAGQRLQARVDLIDGRRQSLRFRVAPARPRIALISKSVRLPAPGSAVAVDLTSPDELPQNARLTFSVRAMNPTRLSGQSSLDVETMDGSASVLLRPGAGLTIEDPGIAIASLDLGKAFGSSVFGGLRVRLVDRTGASDWQPLGTLVRVPRLQDLQCQANAAAPCTLTGSGLFLIDQISATPGFQDPVSVPEGFPGQQIAVPPPANGRLYVRLHDDPQVVNEVRLPNAVASRAPAAPPDGAPVRGGPAGGSGPRRGDASGLGRWPAPRAAALKQARRNSK